MHAYTRVLAYMRIQSSLENMYTKYIIVPSVTVALSKHISKMIDVIVYIYLEALIS